MTHHEGKMSEKDKESSERVQKQRAFEEGRGHDVTSATKATGAGGPEAGIEFKEKGEGPHTMQTESPTTRQVSKGGMGMAGSQGTEGTVTRGQGSQRGSRREERQD